MHLIKSREALSQPAEKARPRDSLRGPVPPPAGVEFMAPTQCLQEPRDANGSLRSRFVAPGGAPPGLPGPSLAGHFTVG